MDKTVEINEIVTFIKATREEALALAYDIGGGEVHALHIQGGFGMPAEKPVGYLVLPLKREWVELSDDELEDLEFDSVDKEYGHLDIRELSRVIEAKLKEKNT